MKRRKGIMFLWICLLTCVVQGAEYEQIRLASDPALAPDGSKLAFAWRGDIWIVPTEGGLARQVTQHPSRDHRPAFSPDGSEIAFVSDRDAGSQVYVMPVKGGTPRQLTFHTAGYTLEQWYPSGDALLVRARQDHFWPESERFFKISGHERKAEELRFDAYGQDGVISTGGTQVMDVGYLRLPFRGWYVLGTGEDMELSGAVPHHIVWNKPGEMPSGKDAQLDKAIKVLRKDVKKWESRPKPQLRKATERAR